MSSTIENCTFAECENRHGRRLVMAEVRVGSRRVSALGLTKPDAYCHALGVVAFGYDKGQVYPVKIVSIGVASNETARLGSVRFSLKKGLMTVPLERIFALNGGNFYEDLSAQSLHLVREGILRLVAQESDRDAS